MLAVHLLAEILSYQQICYQFQHNYEETEPHKRWKLVRIKLVTASLQLALTQIYASFPSTFAKQL